MYSQNIRKHFDGNFIVGVQRFVLNHTQISNLGLIFQRWKVVLEKMTKYALYHKDDDFNSKIYKVDLLLECLQELIYNRIKQIVSAAEDVVVTGEIEPLMTILADESMFVGIYENIYAQVCMTDSILYKQITDEEVKNGLDLDFI